MIKDWFYKSYGFEAYDDRTARYNSLMPIRTPLKEYTKGYRPKKLPEVGSMRGMGIETRIKLPFRKHMKFPTPTCDENRCVVEEKWQYRRKHEVSLEIWLRLAPWYGYYPKKHELDELSVVPGCHANPQFIEWMMGFPVTWTEF